MMRCPYFVLFAENYQGDHMKENEMVRQVMRMGEKRNAYIILVGKPERKRPLKRTTYNWMLGK
jgi:hypothetical protein